MSEKKEKQVAVAASKKDLSIELVSNNGSVGKTVLAIILAEYFRSRGQVALFTLDNNNQELSRVFGSKVNGKTVAPENDDPLTGVGYYDYRTNADEGIRTLRKYKGIDQIKDNPADSIDAQCVMGDFAKQIKGYKQMGKKVVYFVLASSLKCPKSFASLNDLLNSSPDVDMDTIEIVSVLNFGMLNHSKNTENFALAYNNSEAVKALKATGKFHELEINTFLDEKDIEAHKKYRLQEIIDLEENMTEDENGETIIDFYMRSSIADGIYEEVFYQLDKLIPILRR